MCDTKLPTPLRGAIVAMTRDRVIGIDGEMPWHYSEDLKRFKRRTLNSIVIMGRLTWESIGSKPLPQRRNIVVSRNDVAGTESYQSVEDAVSACGNDDLWVIGGGQIYRQTLSLLNVLDITYVPDSIKSPDAVTFPEINANDWEVAEQSVLEGTDLENVVLTRI